MMLWTKAALVCLPACKDPVTSQLNTLELKQIDEVCAMYRSVTHSMCITLGLLAANTFR
jgi:hypothetical protein